MFQVYFQSIKNLIMKYTSSIIWTCFWNAFDFYSDSEMYLRQTFKLYVFIFQTHTWSRLSKLTNLHSNVEVHLKYTF